MIDSMRACKAYHSKFMSELWMMSCTSNLDVVTP
jgi:hypothetical protein